MRIACEIIHLHTGERLGADVGVSRGLNDVNLSRVIGPHQADCSREEMTRIVIPRAGYQNGAPSFYCFARAFLHSHTVSYALVRRPHRFGEYVAPRHF